jgi:folate-binding protein YgfZ
VTTLDTLPGDEGYWALRREQGAVWIARDVVAVSGPDAAAYLQGQCSQDVVGLAIAASAETLLLNPQGKLDAFARVTRRAPEEFLLDIEGGFGLALVERLVRFKLRVKLDIEPLGWRCLALRGPQVASRWFGTDEGTTAVALPVAWPGIAGFDLLGPDPTLPPGVPLCGREAWEVLRIEAGVPCMGTELDNRTIAAEAGLVERTVSFTKGCFTGQELVARLDARGNKVARILRGLVLAPDATRTDIRGAELRLDGQIVGSITSAAFSPSFQSLVALGYLHRSVEPGAELDVVGTSGGKLKARAEELPLIG